VAPRLPKPVTLPGSSGISTQALSARVDAFLSSRGFRPTDTPPADARAGVHSQPVPADTPEDFICEDDVREALKSGRRLLVGDRTIVTPSARELGDANKVFVDRGWPR
jgi:hypothetical protein